MLKKGITLLIIVSFAIVGFIYAMDRLTYTSFQEIAANHINEDDTVTIVIERYSDDAKISISDKATVEKILNDFSRMELKKASVSKPSGEYAIRIYVNGSRTFGVQILQDKDYVWIHNGKSGDEYRIVNDFDPRKTIEDENFVWQTTKG